MTGPMYQSCQASAEQIAEHLALCDSAFIPALSSRVSLCDYALKMKNHALCLEAWVSGQLTGLLCLYCNDLTAGAFITNLSVIPGFQGKGIAHQLLQDGIQQIRQKGFDRIRLELNNANTPAQHLYRKIGFVPYEVNQQSTMMILDLICREKTDD